MESMSAALLGASKSRLSASPATQRAAPPSPGALETRRTPAAGLGPGSREHRPEHTPNLARRHNSRDPEPSGPDAYLAISLLTRVRISSSSTALAQSAQRERGFGPSGVVKLQRGEGTLGPGRGVLAHGTAGSAQRWCGGCRGSGPGSSLPCNLLAQSVGSSPTARLGFAQ